MSACAFSPYQNCHSTKPALGVTSPCGSSSANNSNLFQQNSRLKRHHFCSPFGERLKDAAFSSISYNQMEQTEDFRPPTYEIDTEFMLPDNLNSSHAGDAFTLIEASTRKAFTFPKGSVIKEVSVHGKTTLENSLQFSMGFHIPEVPITDPENPPALQVASFQRIAASDAPITGAFLNKHFSYRNSQHLRGTFLDEITALYDSHLTGVGAPPPTGVTHTIVQADDHVAERLDLVPIYGHLGGSVNQCDLSFHIRWNPPRDDFSHGFSANDQGCFTRVNNH